MSTQLSAMAVFKDENSIEKIFEVCQQHQVVEVPLVENAEPHGVKSKPTLCRNLYTIHLSFYICTRKQSNLP